MANSCSKCGTKLTRQNTLHGWGLGLVRWCDLCWQRLTKPKIWRPKMPKAQSGMRLGNGKLDEVTRK